MIDDPVLLHEWLPVAPLLTLERQNPLGMRVLGQDVVAWNSGSDVLVRQDLCVHRGTRLSLGRVREVSILLFITPHEKAQSTAWMWIAMNYVHDAPEADLVTYQHRIFAQDAPILESQRPELLPLDLQAELHLKSDRTAIAYRKWLRELGLTFGVE